MFAAALFCALASAPNPSGTRETEIARVRQHIEGAERELASHDTRGLTAEQQKRRAKALAALRTYREAQRFPINRNFGEPTPFFVDAAGTRCAMAELIHATGRDELVERIARTQNNARIRELAGDRELISWLEENGITAAEAARVQPNYCYARSSCICGESPSGALEVTFDRTEGDRRVGKITRIFGDPGTHQIGEELSVMTELGFAEATGAFAVVKNSNIGRMNPIDAEHRVRCAYDPPCEASARIDIDAAAAALLSESCVDAVEVIDPRWAGAICDGGGGEVDCNAPPGPKPNAGDPPVVPPSPSVITNMDGKTGCAAAGEGGGAASIFVLALLMALVRRSR